jgi:hypothetical protein
VVAPRIAPTAITGMPASARICSANGTWYMRPYSGFDSGDVAGRRDVDRVAAVLLQQRANATASSRVKPRRPSQSVAEMRTAIGFARATRAHRVEHLEREARAVLEAAAVRVGAPVRQRREEARQQVAVRHVQLDQVEAGRVGARGAATNAAITRSMSARSIAFGAGQSARNGSADGASVVQPPSRSGSSSPSHGVRTSPCARVRELDADAARDVPCTKSTMRATRRRARRVTCRRSRA